MLRRPPTNLNVQSENATILLIREVVALGLDITEVSETGILGDIYPVLIFSETCRFVFQRYTLMHWDHLNPIKHI